MKRNTRLHNAARTGLESMGLALAVVSFTLPAAAAEQTNIGQADQATLEKVMPTKTK